MNQSQKLGRAAVVAALAMAFGAAPVLAQTTGTGATGTGAGLPNSSTQNPSNPQSRDGTSGAAAPNANAPANMKDSNNMRSSTQSGTTNMPKSSNSRSDTMNTWQSRYATEHKGRISRQAYMDEMARRWDSMDNQGQGLTPAEISRLTGHVDVSSSQPARTGSGVQAGNMGPGSMKAQ